MPPGQTGSNQGPGGIFQNASGRPLASYGTRLGGWLIDWLLLAAVGFVISLPFRLHHAHGGMRLGGGAFIIDALIVILYGAMCGSARGQTIGMMAVGARAVDQRNGGPIGIGRGIGRAAFEYLLVIALFIPWIVDMLFPLWDSNNQTLHDKVTNTVVVKL